MARPKLPGSVYQRADGKWVAQLRVDGRKIRKYASSERAANELLKDMRAMPPKVTAAAARTMTVADYVRHWLDESLPHQGLADSTQAMYRSLGASVVIPALGRTRLASFDPSDVEAWLRKVDTLRTKPRTPRATKKNPNPDPIPGRPLSASTKRLAYGVLEKALDTAVRDDLIPTNPVRDVKRPKAGKTAVPVVQPDQAEIALQAAAGTRIETLLWFVTWTGARIGEALALRWDDVDLDRATATIRASAVGSDRTKTAAGYRSVTLIPEVVDRLKAWRKAQRADRLKMGAGWANTDNLVFVTGTGIRHDQFLAELRTSKICFSAFGYGEVCWRDYEAIQNGAVLLKQDMSHVETLPDVFVADETYVPVRWDLSDFEDKVRVLLADPDRCARIAQNALDVLTDWARDRAFVDQVAPIFGATQHRR